jgi:hypothetical protein
MRPDGYHFPDSEIASFYVEQLGPADLSRDIAKTYGVKHCVSIADALTLGRGSLQSMASF